jgi:hypothetical protein
MNEALWLACRKPATMLAYLGERLSDRKSRLFCVACCRTLPHLLADQEAVFALECGERWADGLGAEGELVQSVAPFYRAAEGRQRNDLMLSLNYALRFDDRQEEVIGLIARENLEARSSVTSIRDALIRSYTLQADLLRDIVGNPFRPVVPPAHVPTDIVQLAEAQYGGQDVAFALHDAFLEAGLPELAEHFQAGTRHPKGCWVVDMVLGRC